MNEVSVKVEDFPKDESNSTEAVPEQAEEDPLALESDLKKEPDPLGGEDQRELTKDDCDEKNTKDETISEDQDKVESQTKDIKDEFVIENSNLTNTALDELVKAQDSVVTLKNDKDNQQNKSELIAKDKDEKNEVKQIEQMPENCPEVSSVEVTKSISPDAVNDVPQSKYMEVVKAGIEMKDVTDNKEPKIIEAERKTPFQTVNGVCSKEEATKRPATEEPEAESPLKRLCQEVEKTFPQHDAMVTDYIQTVTKNNVDEIQRHTEQLLAEIQTLRELAQKKEHEWNNILHLKKVKEEILLRLLRRKQVLAFEKTAENGAPEATDYSKAKSLTIDKSDEISGLALKPPAPIQPPMMPVTTHFAPMSGLPPPYDKVAHMHQMPKPMYPQPLMMPGPTAMSGFPREMNGVPSNFGMPMGRQGPTKDVKSIIADYRQRNPDVSPRRGRRMKSILNPNMMNVPRPIAPKMDTMGNLGMIFNNLDMNQKAMLERLTQMQAGGLANGLSFKDVLVQFANMQQQNSMLGRVPETMMPRPEHPRPIDNRTNRRPPAHSESEMHITVKACDSAAQAPRLPPPPPYPEISLLPVTSSTTGHAQEPSQQNSLLHGILTKQASPVSQSFSPTLAKLLTSPERRQAAPLQTYGQKNCGEITITPVQPQPEPSPVEKPEEVVQLDDEESPGSEGEGSGSAEGDAGERRLVIDEGAAAGGAASAGGAGAGAGAQASEGDTPLCQGCRRRDAQFVCAGCANQWYCSRDCQVAAWDDHSEMCSG